LTPENQNAPWVLFEAGALAKTLENAFVCPYLIDLAPSDLVTSPLSQFQAKQANREQTWELILTINQALRDRATPEERLRRIFDRWWPDLEQEIQNPPEVKPTRITKNTLEEMLRETLDEVRELRRDLTAEKLIVLDHELEMALKRSETHAKALQEELASAFQRIEALESSLQQSEERVSALQQKLETAQKIADEIGEKAKHQDEEQQFDFSSIDAKLYVFSLPELGEGTDYGEVTAVLVSVGDRVKQEQAVLEVETDKAVVEIPTPISGTVKAIHIQPGDQAMVGQALITLYIYEAA
jgi:biotin carboxyl carrier protein